MAKLFMFGLKECAGIHVYCIYVVVSFLCNFETMAFKYTWFK